MSDEIIWFWMLLKEIKYKLCEKISIWILCAKINLEFHSNELVKLYKSIRLLIIFKLLTSILSFVNNSLTISVFPF